MPSDLFTPDNAAKLYQELTGADAHHDVVLPLLLGTMLEVNKYLLRLSANWVKERETGEAKTLRPLPEWTRWPAKRLAERVQGAEDPYTIAIDPWLEPFRRPEMLRLVEVEAPGGGSGSLGAAVRKVPTVDDIYEVARVVFEGSSAGDWKTRWRPVAEVILGPGRPPKLGLLTFGMAARAVFEYRATRAHRRTNTAVAMLACVGRVDEPLDRGAARSRWADRFRKFGGHHVERAVDGLVGPLRESGVFEHGVRFP